MPKKDSPSSLNSSKDDFDKVVSMSEFEKSQHDIAMQIHKLGDKKDRDGYQQIRKRQEATLREGMKDLDKNRGSRVQAMLEKSKKKEADKLTHDLTPKGFPKKNKNAQATADHVKAKNDLAKIEKFNVGLLRGDFLEEQQRCLQTVKRRHKLREKMAAKSAEMRRGFKAKSQNSLTNRFNDKGGRSR